MSETVSIADTAPYCFLLSGSIFFLAMVAPLLRTSILANKRGICISVFTLGRPAEIPPEASPDLIKRPSRSGSGSVALSERIFIRAGAVDDRNRDFQQPEVDRQLTAMVVPMVQHDRPEQSHSGI